MTDRQLGMALSIVVGRAVESGQKVCSAQCEVEHHEPDLHLVGKTTGTLVVAFGAAGKELEDFAKNLKRRYA